MPDNPLWMFRPFLSPAPLPLEVISQLQEPMKALQMWLFFSLLLVGAIFDCQKRLIPNTLCALITMVGLLVFHARYIRLGESQIPASGVFHLSLEEQKTIIDALITQHEKYLGLIANTESLLRRMRSR